MSVVDYPLIFEPDGYATRNTHHEEV